MKKLIFNAILKYLVFSTTLLFYSCVDQNTKISGDFALSGFDFDVNPPIVSLISTHFPYVNSTALSIELETGIEMRNCDSFDLLAITESEDEPQDSDFQYSCNKANTQTLSYTLKNTTEGPRTLHIWSKDSRAEKISIPSEIEFILDTTAPTGIISAVQDYIQGGTVHSLSLVAQDNIQVDNTELMIAHHASGNWESVSYQDGFFAGTDVTFPYVDSSSSNLRYFITDAAGNTTEVISNSFIIDSSAPTLAISDPALFLAGGSTYNVDYTAFDLNGLDSLSISYSIDDGVSYSPVAVNPARPYNWTIPMDDSNDVMLRLSAADLAGNSNFTISSKFTIDSTPPAISLQNPPTWLLGGSTYNINYSASDHNGLSTFILEYAQDGVNYTTLTTTNAPPFVWTVPTVDITVAARLRLTAIDPAGNQSQTTTSLFGIDSTAPTVSLADMAAIIRGGISNNVTLSSSDSASGIATAILSYSNDSGSTYSTVASSPSNPTYSWATPSVDLETARLRYVVTDVVGNSTTVENTVFEIDSTAPASTLDSPPSILRGGDTLDLNFTATDKNGISTLELEYAADGTNYVTVQSSPTSPYTWSIPLDDVQTANLRLVSIDPVGNQTIITTSSFEVDSTKPSAPTISLHTPQYTNVTGIGFTMATCDEHFDEVLINTGTTPTDGDTAWVNCNISNGGITYTIPATEGPHDLSAWVRDDAGNISATSTDFTVYYDVTNPVIAVSNPGILSGNTSHTINWTLTETYINNTRSFNVDYWNGSTWVDIVNQAVTTGPHSTQGFSASWTTPGLNRTDIRLRVQVTDLAGNTASSESTNFEIDSIFPPLTIDTPSANSYHKASIVMTGDCETGLPIYFSGAIQEDFSITCSGGSYSQTLNFSDNDGAKLIVASQTDAASNNTTVSRNFYRDEVAPVLTLNTGVNPDFTNQNQPNTWGGTCEGNFTINITGDQTTTIPCSSGTWSWTPSAKTSDGIYNYSLTQTDAAGNTSNPALALSWERDATPPVFNMQSPVVIATGGSTTDTNNQSQISFSGTCEGTNVINITGTQTAAISCSASSWTWSTNTVSTDGTRNYTFTQSDSAGNTASLTYTWIRDTTGPALFLTESSIKSNQNTATFGGTCETGIDIVITGTDSTTITCPSGTWSYTTASKTTDGSRDYTFTQTLLVSPFNSTSVTGTWIRETNAPSFMTYSTSASSPSRKPFIPISLTATSQNPDVFIAKICFKSNSSAQPAANDLCWLEVDSPTVGQPLSQSLTLTNFNILLGWEPMLYNSYAFVMDQAGNISTNSATLGTDRLQITYDPGIAPVLFDVIGSNIGTSSIPPTRSQAEVPPGSDVYIRWKLTDNFPLPAGAISLYYTTDDINFNAITGAEALNQNTDYGCGISLAADEGCYRWVGGSPVSVAYKIQVSVTDTTDITTQQTSNILNSGRLKIIAGNTDNGIGGSAQTATFSIEGDTDDYDGHGIIFTDAGDMFYIDKDRGILTVDESDGSLIVFIPKTGSSTGDGGPAKTATLNYPVAMTLDYQGRMLIYDYNRIRRVDLNLAEPTIETIIGGGSNTADTVANPLDVQFENPCTGCREEDGMTFHAMPNGDIVFWSERPRHNRDSTLPRFRIYKNATKNVISQYFSGTGDAKSASQDLTKCYLYLFGVGFDATSTFDYAYGMSQHRTGYTGCSDADNEYRIKFNPSTFVAETPDNNSYAHYTHYPYTGMDGELYQIISRNYVMKLDKTNGSWTRVLGSGTRGECLDGESATTCNMHIMNLFVSTTGKFYFGDRGSIRTVNDDGDVVTIFGQKRTYGDGVLAINGRFDLPKYVERVDATGKYIVADNSGNFIKEFEVEGNINIIAGTGNHGAPNDGDSATASNITYSDHLGVDPTDGSIIMARNHSYGEILKLNRGNGLWERIIGAGGTSWFNAANGTPGLSIASGGNQNRGRIVGYADNKVMQYRFRYESSNLRYEDSHLALYDGDSSYSQKIIMGIDGYPADNNTRRFCTGALTSTTASTCEVPQTTDTLSNVSYDSYDDKWIIAIAIGGTQQDVFYYYESTDTITKVAYTAQDIENWYKYVRYPGPDTVAGNGDDIEKLIYCSTSGIVRVHNITTDSDEGHVPWPMSNLSCMGRNAGYNPVNDSIIFTFEQNGLYGVAEYFLP